MDSIHKYPQVFPHFFRMRKYVDSIHNPHLYMDIWVLCFNIIILRWLRAQTNLHQRKYITCMRLEKIFSTMSMTSSYRHAQQKVKLNSSKIWCICSTPYIDELCSKLFTKNSVFIVTSTHIIYIIVKLIRIRIWCNIHPNLLHFCHSANFFLILK